ncbi:hypothetical protein QVD17_31506 [Tagetes erecta]|uniref:Uncharacterized protein n=1 Tax=Tagetes erecta TaxID=13708 RepID=A0AAD8K747_TARER|nr:hypothetical protein QVD17_31506 [Tagetes erecta]
MTPNNADDAEQAYPILQTLRIVELSDRSASVRQRCRQFLCNATITTAHKYRLRFCVKCWGWQHYKGCNYNTFNSGPQEQK